jgi:putative nucleotidyltransferase with HDIG domain
MTVNPSATSRKESRRPPGKIVYWFLAVLAAVALLPLGITAWKLIGTSRETLVTSQQEVQLQIAAGVVRQLDASVQAMQAQLGRLGETLTAPGRAAGAAAPDARLLERILGPDLLVLRYTPRAGPPVEVRRNGLPARLAGEALTAAATAALAGETAAGAPIIVAMEGGETITALVIGVPVGAGRADAGALTAAVDFARFWTPLVGGRRAAYMIYALDPQGRIFAAQDEEGLLQRADYTQFGVVQDFLKAGGHSALTTEFEATIDGRVTTWIASFDTTRQGWGVVVQIDKRQAYAVVNQMVQATLIWAALAVGLALVLSYFLASIVTRPIQQLTAGAEAFARGDLDQRVSVRSRNEIGTLAETFNTMADQVQDYIVRLRAAAQENSELFMGTVKALAEAIDEKDPYTRGHSDRVNKYAVLLAKQLGLSRKEIRDIHIASLFHDIGKIGIEDKILRKPAVLTDQEYTVMKQHPDKGAQMLTKIKAMKDIIPGMHYHHERWDGTGYPKGMKGEQIPLAARIVAVADAFDAMTTNRPYQKAMPFDKAIARLFELSDRAFDRRVVSAFADAYKAGQIREPAAAVAEEQ